MISFHKTPEVLETRKTNHVQVAMIPPGCTRILQPLDTHVNRPFKAILSGLVEDTQLKKANSGFKWTPSIKRVRMAKAYERLCDQHGDIICICFLDVSLSLPPD